MTQARPQATDWTVCIRREEISRKLYLLSRLERWQSTVWTASTAEGVTQGALRGRGVGVACARPQQEVGLMTGWRCQTGTGRGKWSFIQVKLSLRSWPVNTRTFPQLDCGLSSISCVRVTRSPAASASARPHVQFLHALRAPPAPTSQSSCAVDTAGRAGT